MSVYFEYPQFNFPFVPWLLTKTYEGVFYYNGKEWMLSSQTIFPEFFSKIFKAIRKGKEPKFAINPLGLPD